MPDPVFVKTNDPEPFVILPLNSVLLLSPPTVNVFAPTVLVVTVPAPAIDPIVSVALTLYVAPVATLTAVLSLKLPLTVKVPALTVVAPV